MNTPDSHHWTLNSCFGVFLSVWVHLEPFRYCTKLVAKHAKLVQLMQKLVPRSHVGIFRNERSRSTPFGCIWNRLGAINTTNTPDPHHWTLNSCFGAFLYVWVHLGPFHYCTKLGAKWAKLVQLIQKFMPRSRVGIFHNVCSRSTPLDPKLMFSCVSFRLGAFGTVSLLH
jgi:hypothetical protein